MNVFFVTNNYKPYAGGVVHSIDVLANALRTRGHVVYIITLDFLKISADDSFVIRVPSMLRFRYKKNHMAVPIQPTKQLKRLVEQLNPDIIHVHHPFLLGVTALGVANKLGLPIVFTYHTQYEQYVHYVPMPQKLIKLITDKLVKRFCNAVDAIIAPTKTIAQQLQHKKIVKPITVLPSAIDDQFYEHQKQQEKNEKFQLLLVSRLAKEKNIRFLLRVMKKLDQHKFQFTLCGYGQQADSLQYYAYQKLGLSRDSVRFILQPDRATVINQYCNADLFIFASTTETQGLVLAEAMACGLPVVALDAPGSCDIIIHGSNGYLVSDEQQMVACINKLATDVDCYQQFKQAAIETSLDYKTDKIVADVIDLYSHLQSS